MMMVRETISHGATRATRTRAFTREELGSGIGVPHEHRALAIMGESSLYPFKFNANTNRFHAQAAITLRDTGRCDIGWSTFEVDA